MNGLHFCSEDTTISVVYGHLNRAIRLLGMLCTTQLIGDNTIQAGAC